MRESTIHKADNSSKTTPKRTNYGVVIERERLKFHEVSLSGILINIFLHITLHILRVGWAAQNGDVVTQILKNRDSVVLDTVRALAPDCFRVDDSIHGSVVLATSGIGVTEDGVLQEGSSIVERVTCVALQC